MSGAGVEAGMPEAPEDTGGPAWCGRCGQAARSGDHAACERALELEPPRYCAQCRRRMIVQVTPTGWIARCSEHGELVSG